MTQELSPQLYTAFKLARAYGHEWAVTLGLAGVEEAWELAIEEERDEFFRIPNVLRNIEAFTRERSTAHDSLPAGILCPELEGYAFVHTTLSGRLRWRVYLSGDVEFSVFRPHFSEPVLIVHVSALVEGSGRELVIQQFAGVHVRHWAAVTEAINALSAVE